MTLTPRSSAAGSSASRRALVEQGVPACHSTTSTSVSVTNRVSIPAWFMPAPIAPHDALGPQSLQRRVGLAECLLPVVVRIVDQRDVDPVQAEPDQAGLHAAPHAVGAVVEHRRWCAGTANPSVSRPCGSATGLQQAPDLGGDDVLVARPPGQRGAEAALGQAEAVVRGRVERADAARPRRVDRRRRGLVV